MIVACSSCNARFRVADGKIGPRGARIRCSRCGQTFAVPPPEPPKPVAAPAPPERPAREPAAGPVSPANTTSEATGTGGWPTGILEVQGGAGADAGTPAAAKLEGDPFAAFASAPGGATPEPTPLGTGLQPPSGATAERSGFLDSLPVTSLSDLERTGALRIAPAAQAPDFPTDGGLALEDRTPVATPVREAAPRWNEPEATNAVAVGLDGFQEVDLAGGAAPPDPDFDPVEPEPTPASQAPRPASPHPTPPAQGVGLAPVAGSAAPVVAPSPGVPEPARVRPRAPRLRILAMNVLSLAALLVVTAGILVWWRGEGIGASLRWPGSAKREDLEVRQVSSGVYEGTRGHPVVFVRGVVRATRAPVDGPVSVRVELVRAGQSLGMATGTAGAVPGADELSGLATDGDLDRLRADLRARAPARLEPGQDLPFLVFLARPDGDVGALRFRIEPVPAPGR